MPRRVDPSEFVTLQQASQILGVHPATVRSWADQGKLKVVRTAGGHRRFFAREVRALSARPAAASDAPDAQLIIHSALGRARMELTDGRGDAQPWRQMFDEDQREQHREMGRALLDLMAQYMQAQNDAAQTARTLRRARTLGGRYGKLAAARGLSLADAMRAFLFFRDFLLESAVQMRALAAGADGDALATFRLLNTFANEVLIAMVSTYQGAT